MLAGMTDLPTDPRELLIHLMERDQRSMEWVSKQLGRNKAYVHQYLTRFKPKRLDELDRAKLARLFYGVTPDNFRDPEEVRVNDSLTTPAQSSGQGDSQAGRNAEMGDEMRRLWAFVMGMDKRLTTLEEGWEEPESRPRNRPKAEES